MKWYHGLLFAFGFIVGLALYHNGLLNLIFPGRKTVSKKSAKRFAAYVAETANVGQQNLANSTPSSLNNPVPLPVIDTWSAHDEDEKKAA
jgi:hypothetical protein